MIDAISLSFPNVNPPQGAGLVWLGHYSGGVPTGVCWQAVLGSAWLVGHLDTAGQMTGSDLAFLYPDLRTALVGRFKNGELLSAFHSKVISVTEKSGVLVLSFEKVSANEFRSIHDKKKTKIYF